MSFQPGAKLGPYEILASIDTDSGSEVYRASDARENRTVAIRVFPPQWSADPAFPQMKQRFEREARTVASLAHPHICAMDIAREDGVEFLVTEYLEGQTLTERLKGKALDLNEAMTVGIAIADALDKAHGAGVVHRGLSPSTVMLTETGAKLLDFGLAEFRPSQAPPPSGQSGPRQGEALNSPYAAPEQYEGKPADARSDIFAFGAVLYEMVTGKKAFEGRSRAALIAAIATADPEPLRVAQPKAPRALEHVVERCLAKDPDNRWQTAHDLTVQLRWIAEGGAHGAASGPDAARARKRERLIRVLLGAAVLMMVALAFPAVRYFRGPGELERVEFRVPVRGLSQADIALSPDGQTMALVLRPEAQGTASLYVRRVGAVAFQRLGGTDDATQPFFSPDSRFIAFVAGGRLKKVSVLGGAPQDIAEAQGFSGGAWNREGIILFGSAKGLLRVSAEGGKPAAVTTIDAQETGHYWPGFLPDGRRFLYLAWSGQAANRAVFVGKLDSKEKTKLLAAESNAAYAAPGYVLFHREASLFAQPFDAGKLALRGDPVHVADQVATSSANGRGNFDVSQNGVLLYYQGTVNVAAGRGGTVGNFQLGWVDRSGRALADAGETGTFGDFDLSPDGKLIAITRQDPGSPGADIWVTDWQRAGNSTRLTLDPADDINPVWSPDGTRVAFTTYRKGNADIYVKNANGVGAETPLLESSNDEIVEDWSKDGRYIAYLSGQDNFQDIYALPMSGEKPSPDQKPFPLVQGHFQKNQPQFSYDGKWLAYTSDESGQFEVYVISFPALDQKLKVSTEGGGQPRWRKDGKELYYRAPASTAIMAVDIKTSGKLESGVPHALFTPTQRGTVGANPIRHQLAVTPDGQRFLLRIASAGGGRGVGGSGVTNAPAQFFAPGQTGGRGGRGGLVTFGLTVIQHWTTALGKADQ